MTQNQLLKALNLHDEIEESKKRLGHVNDFEHRIPEVCARGICINNGLNFDTVIVPREEEIKALLVTMRNRLENRIAELEKEFAEL